MLRFGGLGFVSLDPAMVNVCGGNGEGMEMRMECRKDEDEDEDEDDEDDDEQLREKRVEMVEKF